MDEREITMRQALTTLRKGRIERGPEVDEFGGWKVVLVRYASGRQIRVVTVLAGGELVIVTVV